MKISNKINSDIVRILSFYLINLRYCVILISMFKLLNFYISRGVFPLIMNNTNQVFTRLNPNQIPHYDFLHGISTVRFSQIEKLYRYFSIDHNRPKSIQAKTKSKPKPIKPNQIKTKPNQDHDFHGTNGTIAPSFSKK